MNKNFKKVEVALRIRPLNQREKNDACSECLRTISNEPQVIVGRDKSFTYDYVYDQNSTQINIYEKSVKPLLDYLFTGLNTSVLAYGQTDSGKTYTMGLGNSELSTVDTISNITHFDEVGIIPRVLNDLFTRIDNEQNVNIEIKYYIKVSFVEVYNEEIKDLFCFNGRHEPLNIREENNTIRILNLSEIEVKNSKATIELLKRGSQKRVIGGTSMNHQSSRSHAIFTITLEQTNRSTNGGIIKSKFNLVDLAGSERQSKVKVTGIRLQEGININLGLLALGNVISVLGEDNPTNRTKHVPYRESKLTRLLQDSLGGNSHTVMIACVSPADSNMEETLNTLRYAERSRKIKNKPIVNIDPHVAELNNLRQQIQELKDLNYRLTSGTETLKKEDNSSEFENLKNEKESLEVENKSLLEELKRITISNQNTYERYAQIEMERDELKIKFEEIKEAYQKMIPEAEENEDNASHQRNEIKNKMEEFENLKKESNEIESELQVSDLDEPMEREHTLRQAKMQCQFGKYEAQLVTKENLFRDIVENMLIKVREERKVETQEYTKKEKDFMRMTRIKQENERHYEKLKIEIQNIKNDRAKLLKQMKSETDSFSKFRKNKDKEVNQLKAVERKCMAEITKLQKGNEKQEAVLKRKNQEITRLRKMFKDKIEKEKQVAEKRQQNFDLKDKSQMGEKLRNWISEELDLSVQIAVARIIINELIEERKESAADLLRLQQKIQELEDFSNEVPGSVKKFVSNFSDEEIESLIELEEKIEVLKTDIEGKSLQINEIQQMIIENEQEDRSKCIFETVHSLLEAKILLKHLFNCCVENLLVLNIKKIRSESETI